MLPSGPQWQGLSAAVTDDTDRMHRRTHKHNHRACQIAIQSILYGSPAIKLCIERPHRSSHAQWICHDQRTGSSVSFATRSGSLLSGVCTSQPPPETWRDSVIHGVFERSPTYLGRNKGRRCAIRQQSYGTAWSVCVRLRSAWMAQDHNKLPHSAVPLSNSMRRPWLGILDGEFGSEATFWFMKVVRNPQRAPDSNSIQACTPAPPLYGDQGGLNESANTFFGLLSNR